MDNSGRLVWISIIALVITMGIGGVKLSRHSKITKPHSVQLPAKPYTVEHLPVLKAKLNELRVHAAALRKSEPRLPGKAAEEKFNQVWEDLFYTPEFYPAFLQVRAIETAKVVQLRPELADHMRLVAAFQDGRYAIANNPGVSDKTGALKALSDRLGPALKNPEYARHKEKFMNARRELVGDAELDEADEVYQRFRRAELTKRLPELARYFEQSAAHYDACNAVIAEGNVLRAEIDRLERGTFRAKQGQ
jgi:hypothetical protein